MKTWLDEYVRWAGECMDDLMARVSRQYGFDVKFPSDFNKALTYTQMAFMTPESIAKWRADNIFKQLPADLGMMNRLYWQDLATLGEAGVAHSVRAESIANKAIYFLGSNPVLADGSPWHSPLALQITPELARDFQGVKAPATDAYREIFDTHKTVYVDLPPDTVRWDQEVCVRGIFVVLDLVRLTDLTSFWMKHGEPVLHPDRFPKLNILAILQGPGRLSSENLYTFGFAEDEPYSAYGLLRGGERGSFAAHADTFAPRMEQITDLARLAILYHMSGEGQREEVPHYPPDKLPALKRLDKQRAKQKTHSLFRVTRLSSPPGAFGHTAETRESGAAWRLDHRVRVRTHFRWQACGKGWKEHRLRVIAAHERGPKEAPLVVKPELHVLHTSRPDAQA